MIKIKISRYYAWKFFFKFCELQDVDPLLDYLENNLKVLYKKLEATIYPLFSEEILKAEIIILLENLEVGVSWTWKIVDVDWQAGNLQITR